jgi:hypothetical protein
MLAFYNYLDIRALLAEGRDGGWIVEGLRVRTVREKPELMRGLPCLDELKGIQEVRPASELESILREATSGALRLGESEARLIGDGSQEPNLHFSATPRGQEGSLDLPEWGTLRLTGWYPTWAVQSKRAQRPDVRLQQLEIPWENKADLSTHFLRTKTYHSGTPTLEFEVPIPVRFAPPTAFSGQELEIAIERTDASIEEGSVAIIAEHDVGVFRHRLTLKGLAPNNRNRIILQRVPLPTNTRRVAVRLSFLEEAADVLDFVSLPTRGTNPRFLAVKEFHPGGLDKLLANISEKKGRDFENVVATCLELCGFAVIQHGTTGNEADLTAFPPNDSYCIVIECTVGRPDLNNKVGKLSQRARALQNATGRPCYPMLVTQLHRHVWNQTDQEKAGKERVAICGPPQLEEAWLKASRGAAANTIRDYFESLIPALDGSPHRGNWDRPASGMS